MSLARLEGDERARQTTPTMAVTAAGPAGCARRPGTPLEQSAAQRARVDTSKWAGAAPVRFGLLTTTSTAGLGVVVGLVPTGVPLGVRLVAAVGGACVGFLLPVGVLFMIAWLTAPRRQRNEARDEVKRLTQPADLSELASEFSSWVVAKRASLPKHGLRMIPSFPDPNSEAWANHEKRQDEVDRLQAKARSEYHERFRARVAEVLGTDAEDPQNVSDLEALAQKLQDAAEREQRQDRIAAARGKPVSPNHQPF